MKDKENRISTVLDTLKSRPDTWLLLGLPFDAVNLTQAAELIEESIAKGKRCFFSTPNINFTIAASTDQDFYESVVMSQLSIVDGMPLVWLAKLFGLPIEERVAGSDLFDYLLKKPRQNPIRIFFFGGEHGIAELAHRKLNDSDSGMISVGYYDPGFVSVEDMSQDHILEKINAAKPDFLLVALGAKKGQSWIMRNLQSLDVPVVSHLGAVINFVAGHVVRAPTKWRRYGLEWLWRIKQEPVLWRRYMADGFALLKILFTKLIPYWVYDRMYRQDKSTQSQMTIENGCVYLSGNLDDTVLPAFIEYLETEVDAASTIIQIDMSGVSYINSAFMARLLLLDRLFGSIDIQLTIKSPSKKVRRLMTFAGVIQQFKLS